MQGVGTGQNGLGPQGLGGESAGHFGGYYPLQVLLEGEAVDEQQPVGLGYHQQAAPVAAAAQAEPLTLQFQPGSGGQTTQNHQAILPAQLELAARLNQPTQCAPLLV